MSEALESLLSHLDKPHYRALIMTTDHAALRKQLRERFPEATYSPKLWFFKFPSDACLYVYAIPDTEHKLYRFAACCFHSIMVEGEFIYAWYKDYLGGLVKQPRGRNPLDQQQVLPLHYWVNGIDQLKRT